MNMLDLFSGIGGFSLAIQRSGIKINKHYFSEVDKYAEQIYRKQFPGAIRLGDVTKIGNEYGKIDIITGGFPCQSFSIAGKRGGFSDTRGTLFFEIERLSRFYKPTYMVLENVKGLFSHDGGNTIRVVLDKLRGLDYSVQLLLLNTVDFGIPQNRERVFFICTARGKRRPGISSIRERKTKTPFSSNAIDANYWKGIDNHGQRTCIGTLRTHKDGEGFREMKSGVCPTIPARAREDGSGQPMLVQAICTPEIDVKGQNGRIIKDPEDPMFTLSVRDRHGIAIQRCFKDQYSVKKGITGTLQSSRIDKVPMTIQDTIIRRLTPIECERLQDYPDDYTKYGITDSGEQVGISDTQRYKTLGNSITVKVAEEIFKTIKESYPC